MVRDRHPVVIGGLIEDRVTEQETKVPYLGDIPYLGWLFRVSTEDNEKVNLLIMITPHVIRSPLDLQNVTNDRREDTDRFFQGAGEVNRLERLLDERRIQRERHERTAPAPSGLGPGLSAVDGPRPSSATGRRAPATSRLRVAQAYGTEVDVALPAGTSIAGSPMIFSSWLKA